MSSPGPLTRLLARWREDAAALERHGREDQAERLRRYADEVEDALRRRRTQLLTIAAAAERGGFSEKTLRRRCREGTIDGAEKVGGEWRIPRSSYPRKGEPENGAPEGDSPVKRHVERIDGGR